MGSNWGSVYPGDEVFYAIAVTNNRPTDGKELAGLTVSSQLPANLEVLSATSDRGDLTQNGNSLSLALASLKPGETAEIGVRTRVKADVAFGTVIVSQASLTYTGVSVPLYSNPVTVQVVRVAQVTAQPTVTSVPTATAAPAATAQPTATAAGNINNGASGITATAVPTGGPTAQPTATPAPGTAAPLPDTSGGIPLMGFVLLGMTLFVRTVRLHRGQNRI